MLLLNGTQRHHLACRAVDGSLELGELSLSHICSVSAPHTPPTLHGSQGPVER